MRRPKMFALALGALFAMASTMASGASALPEIHLLEKEAFPVTASGSLTVKGGVASNVSTALSKGLNAETVNVNLTFTELGSLGTYVATLLNVKEPTSGLLCTNVAGGFATGKVVIEGPIHFVYLAPLTPLKLGASLLLEPVLKITCGKAEKEEKLIVTVEADALAAIEGVENMVDVTSFKGNLKCTKPGNGKQEFKEYFNDKEEIVKLTVLVNIGLGKEAGCDEENQPVPITPSKMINFLF
jgi:hypothetical protein